MLPAFLATILFSLCQSHDAHARRNDSQLLPLVRFHDSAGDLGARVRQRPRGRRIPAVFSQRLHRVRHRRPGALSNDSTTWTAIDHFDGALPGRAVRGADGMVVDGHGADLGANCLWSGDPDWRRDRFGAARTRARCTKGAGSRDCFWDRGRVGPGIGGRGYSQGIRAGEVERPKH